MTRRQLAHFFAQLTSPSGSQEERKRIRLRLFRRRLENYIFGGFFLPILRLLFKQFLDDFQGDLLETQF
jgi:hypothetical protein